MQTKRRIGLAVALALMAFAGSSELFAQEKVIVGKRTFEEYSQLPASKDYARGTVYLRHESFAPMSPTPRDVAFELDSRGLMTGNLYINSFEVITDEVKNTDLVSTITERKTGYIKFFAKELKRKNPDKLANSLLKTVLQKCTADFDAFDLNTMNPYYSKSGMVAAFTFEK